METRFSVFRNPPSQGQWISCSPYPSAEIPQRFASDQHERHGEGNLRAIGHADTKTMELVYSHMFHETIKEASDAISKALSEV